MHITYQHAFQFIKTKLQKTQTFVYFVSAMYFRDIWKLQKYKCLHIIIELPYTINT